MPQTEYRPLKIVLPSDTDFKPDTGGGRPWEPFDGPPSHDVRQSLASQVEHVKSHFSRSFYALHDLPAVAKVVLKPEAVAKSYRPLHLFNKKTCPIIGANKLGELYVSAKPSGLDRLADALAHDTTTLGVAHISTLKGISPYTIEDALGQASVEEILSKAKRKREVRLRLLLFRHHSPAINVAIDKAFRKLAHDCDVAAVERLSYADNIRVFCVKNVSKQNALTLAGFPGTQSLSHFPIYGIARAASHAIGSLTANHFPGPIGGRSYPVVGIIDSGTDPRNPLLQAWVTALRQVP